MLHTKSLKFHKCIASLFFADICTFYLLPSLGNTKLTLPFGAGNQLVAKDEAKWLVDEGGCTVWFDEPSLLERTQTRVGGRMQIMDSEDFSVAGVLESPLPPEQRKKKASDDVDMEKEPPSRRALKRKSEVVPKAVVYGAKKKDSSAATAAKQINAIAPVVSQLSNLEVRAQQLFARMMWGSWTADMSALAGGAAAAAKAAKTDVVTAFAVQQGPTAIQ